MPQSRLVVGVVFVAVAAAAAGGVVFVAGRDDAPARAGASPRARPAPGVAVHAGGGDGVGEVGASAGLFDRLTHVRAPTSDLVIRLFSPFPAVEECLERCPPQMRLVGGREGHQLAWEAAEGIADGVERLAAEPALDREFGATMRTTVAALRRSAEGTTGRGLRALLVRGVDGVPAGSAYGIGLSLSDKHDAYFDHHRAPRGDGVRMLVNRVQGAEVEGVEAPVSGVIEFAGDGVGGGGRDLHERVRPLRHPLGLHFGLERASVVGLALDADGEVYVYNYWGDPLRRLPRDPALRRAIEGVLRRL
jgi:hypothetical protein